MTGVVGQPVTPLAERFRDTMRQVAGPVCVVTTIDDSGPYGTTVSAFMSLSMTPPMIVLSLDRTSRLLAKVAIGARLGVNILASDQHALATSFAGKSDHKFDGVTWYLESGAPRLDGCHGWVAAVARELVDGGDHVVVLAEVTGAHACEGHLPLTYHDRSFGTHREV